MTLWQALFAILSAVLLWALVHPMRRILYLSLRDWLGTSRFVVSVPPGSLPIDRVNQVLGIRTHYITRYEAHRAGEMEEVHLDFAGLTPAARAEILRELKRFPSASDVRLEAGPV